MTATPKSARESAASKKSSNDLLRNVPLDEGPVVGGAQAASRTMRHIYGFAGSIPTSRKYFSPIFTSDDVNLRCDSQLSSTWSFSCNLSNCKTLISKFGNHLLARCIASIIADGKTNSSRRQIFTRALFIWSLDLPKDQINTRFGSPTGLGPWVAILLRIFSGSRAKCPNNVTFGSTNSTTIYFLSK